MASRYTGYNPLELSLISVSIFNTEFDIVTTDVGSAVVSPVELVAVLLRGKECTDAAMLTTKIAVIIVKDILKVLQTI